MGVVEGVCTALVGLDDWYKRGMYEMATISFLFISAIISGPFLCSHGDVIGGF